jgi:uncharacterized protein YndB with AHSA1/START domain
MYNRSLHREPGRSVVMGITIGLLNVRRSILIQATPERVWQEFETFDRINAWFGRGHELHRFELKLGGQVDMSVEMDGERRHYGGPVVVLDREREVTFESNWVAPNDWPVPTFFTLRLTPVYDGTMVEIFHHGFERFGADAADTLEGYEGGWDIKHLKALRAIVE